jgi:hypothetical protein
MIRTSDLYPHSPTAAQRSQLQLVKARARLLVYAVSQFAFIDRRIDPTVQESCDKAWQAAHENGFLILIMRPNL